MHLYVDLEGSSHVYLQPFYPLGCDGAFRAAELCGMVRTDEGSQSTLVEVLCPSDKTQAPGDGSHLGKQEAPSPLPFDLHSCSNAGAQPLLMLLGRGRS